MSAGPASSNSFLTLPTGRLLLSQAVPMVLVMTMSGLLHVVDAAFLGHFVGADALGAVSLVFPAFMVTVALSNLVSGGMSSLFARALGANRRAEAGAFFAQAHGLSLCVSLAFIAAFWAGGAFVIARLATGQAEIAAMAWTYLAILIHATPVQFLLGVHADAWRNEGRMGLVALLSIGVTLANIALNFVLIAGWGMGVAGSALGTVLAQAAGLALLVALRGRGHGLVPLAALSRSRWIGRWGSILKLGAPVSFGFLGIALVSVAVILAVRLAAGEGFTREIAAYGIATRLFGFVFLPLMAIGLAMQSIAGNNAGAGLHCRARAVLRQAMGAAFLYGVTVEAGLLGGAHPIAGLFADDPAVALAASRILRLMGSLYLFTGPVLVLALYFQSVGRPGPAALLTLVKPFLLSPALVLALTALAGDSWLWFAFPIGDGVMALLALAIGLPVLRGRNAPADSQAVPGAEIG
jgi:putative MATE family efflux protein